jgi:zinc D-Ala-D-Ala carboxypeptidase
MTKQTVFLLAGAAICISSLAVIGGISYASDKKIMMPAAIESEKDSIKKIQAEKVTGIISTMGERAKNAVRIDDMDAFIADLDKVLAFNAENPANDLPLLTLVDKQHYLPDGYVPKQLIPLVKNNDFSINRGDLSLRAEAEAALHTLSQAALKDGTRLLVSSSYRSYEYQKTVYEKWVRIDGQEEADRESARPGTSQHQLGTAVDFGSITDDFAETPEGSWLYANAEEYGWSLSFPQGYEDVTGYRWECWHFRYIGKDACRFQKKYFGDIQQFMIEFINSWTAAQN